MPARRSSTTLQPSFAVERFTLDNGLRVVLSPDRSAPTVGMAVTYDVGFRSEPEGRTGFAHLFEHLMFQGSVNLEKGLFDKLIMGNGGVNNGSTRFDFTNYIAQVPSNALELTLFILGDCMLGLNLTQEALQNQIDVVKEEIRVNVMNRPYGGFPWIDLPAVMYRTYNNAHNGYGSFVDLESATAEDAAEFFEQYYAPANAVLAVAGDLDVDDTHAMIERHFGGVDPRPVAPLPDFGEPLPESERRTTRVDPLAPMPAIAVGYRVPDPVARFDDHCATVLLCEALCEGESSRLYQRLVKQDRFASHVYGTVGSFGAFQMRDPSMLELVAFHPGGTAQQVLDAIDEEAERIAMGSNGGAVGQEELDRARTGHVSNFLRSLDTLIERASTMGIFELEHGRAELVNELPSALARVTPAQVTEAAESWMAPNRRAVVELRPGGSK